MTKDNLATALALITVEIDGSEIDQGRTFKDKVTGMTKPLPGSQAGFIWQGDKYPIKVAIPIPEGRAPYRPGTYLLAGSVFAPGDYGRILYRGDRNLELIDLETACEALLAIAKEESAAAKPDLKKVG